MKTCWKCKKTKELTEFGPNKSKPDGLAPECRPCKREYDREYYRKNKQYYITKGHLRAKGVRQAKPKWLTDDHLFIIEEIYELRDLRSKLTGVVHHVDHIVPLRGQNCCGLHVPWNLQVIPAQDNLSKSNSL